MEGSPSPSPHTRDPLLHRQDWELLSASTLLTQSHILGFGLGFRREDADRDSEPSSRNSGNSVEEMNPSLLSFSDGYGRSSVPLDMSQISAMYASSTSTGAPALEPFTEGWEPQFRIAGAPLQEDYYGREDPFVVLDQIHHHRSEPFLVMEQNILLEPDSISINKEEEEKDRVSSTSSSIGRTRREGERFGVERAMDMDEEEDDEDDDDEEEDEDDDEDGDAEEKLKKCSFRVVKSTKRKVSSLFSEKIPRWNLEKHMYQRSHIILSVAIAAALLGVFLYRRSNTS